MKKREIKALQTVLEYLSDEKEHFELSGCPRQHIYRSIAVLENYVRANTGSQPDVALWRCRNCGFANPHGNFICGTCGYRNAAKA